MYNNVKICVRMGGKTGKHFDSDLGVKQGDPLSPLLFGLFIDRLENLMNDALPGLGIKIAECVVKMLLYADDLVLFAESPADLQKMLDVLLDFCRCTSMNVNIKKSEAVIFNKAFETNTLTSLFYDGKELALKSMFIYLGMVFDEDKGIKTSIARNIDKGRKAMYAVIRRCYQLGIANVGLKCHLFDTMVKPILNYGCEVWGPASMCSGNHMNHGVQDVVERLHLSFIKQSLGVRATTCTASIMCELNREPVPLSWMRLIVGFWNKVQKRPEDDLVKMAMKESYELASLRGLNDCWAAQFAKCLRREGVHLQYNSLLNANSITKSMHDRWWCHITRGYLNYAYDVRGVPDDVHKGFKHATYMKWFHSNSTGKHHTFWYNLNDFSQIKAVAQFRLGSHWLNIERGRYTHSVRRSQRICKCCDMKDREDEVHLLACPMYFDIRDKHAHIFKEFPREGMSDIPRSIDVTSIQDVHVNLYMNPSVVDITSGNCKLFWYTFARVLMKCREKRDNYLMWVEQHSPCLIDLPDDPFDSAVAVFPLVAMQ